MDDIDQDSQDTAAAIPGVATALLGSGALFTALGVVFDGGIGTTFSIVGVIVILCGAALLGKFVSDSRAR